MTGETATTAGATASSAAAPTSAASSASTSATLHLPLAVSSSSVSEEMRSLLDDQKKVHEQILKLQAQIEEEEAVYLEETSHGNIIRGWDGFIDSKQSRKDAALKKIKPYTESEHLFSSCCFYKTLAHEPTSELADYFPRDETAAGARRRNSATSLSSAAASSTASSATGGGSGRPASTGTATGASLKLERKSSFSASGTATPPTLGRPPKIKKRKRLDRLEIVSTASATQSETGEDDEPPPTSARLKKSQSTASDAAAADSGDFVDML